MRFAEEILLLLLNEETGYFISIPEWNLSCVLVDGDGRSGQKLLRPPRRNSGVRRLFSA